MERKDNTFVLFKKDKKTDNHPDYSGTGKVGGVDVELAIWSKVSEKGTEYFSGKFTIVGEAPKSDAKEPKVDNSIDDDIPF